MAALEWLQSNNPYYTDLEIYFEALLTYPDNSEDLLDGLHTVTVETGEDESPAATVYTEQEAETGVTYSAIPTQVPGGTVREEIRRHVLGEAAQVVNDVIVVAVKLPGQVVDKERGLDGGVPEEGVVHNVDHDNPHFGG